MHAPVSVRPATAVPPAALSARIAGGLAQLLRFAREQALSCALAVAVFAGLGLTQVVPLPLPRYDAMLLWCVGVTLLFWVVRLETTRELAVIAAFHLVGLAMELFKVRFGSWSYPGDAWTKLAGVPLYSGFMYAAVGSYICQAWRRLDLRVTAYRPWVTALVAAGIYVNFFTHHFFPDVRLPLTALLLAATWRTWVHFTVGSARYRLPLSFSFLLIGSVLWLAENAATFLGAWAYPGQETVWHLVHPGKLGAWSLLVVVSFVLVAFVKALEGRLHAPRRPVRATGRRQETGRATTPVDRSTAAELVGGRCPHGR